jgi:NTE family protein
MFFNRFQKVLFILLFILFSISSASLFSETEEKKVGLVLSGGGALGMAHIGVLKMIEKYDIPVDYITGTSMGAIIGALYASGYSASEIETILRSIDWIPLLSDKKERKDIDLNDRELFEKYILSLQFEKAKLKLPEGAVYGQNIYNLLSSLTWHVRNIDDFSKLPIPFKCIGTDLETGEAVVLDRGSIADAVRASMAIPTAFSAIEIDNRLLVDGGVVRNIPVSDIKRMGADITIVSDVGTPLYSREELKSLLAVFDQLIKLRFSTSNEYELSLAERVITYDLKGYSIASFFKSSEIIEKGNEALADHEEYFKNLSLKLNRKKTTVKPGEKPLIVENIKITGNTRTEKKNILKILGIKENEVITKEDLIKSVSSLYGTGDYYLIRYTAKNNTLTFNLNESPEGINSFGINYNTYDGAGILLNARSKGYLLDNSTSRFKLKLGENYLIGLNYSIPVLFDLFELGFGGEIYRRDFYSYDESGDKNSQIYSDFYTLSGSLEYSSFKSFKPGLFYDYNLINFKEEISLDKIDENLTYSSTGLYTKFDTLSRPVYPRKGINFECIGEYISVSDYFSELPFVNPEIDDYFQIKSSADIYFPISSYFLLFLHRSAL